jgi:hypothetical protein
MLAKRFGPLGCIGACFALAACTASTGEIVLSSAVPQDKLSSTVEPIPGWSEIEKLQPRFVVFGELHGTREAPLLVAELATKLAAQGKRVLVAVEHEARFNTELQSAWIGSPNDFATRLKTLGWAGQQDGRASEAMFDMLTMLQKEKHAGLPLSIVAFNSFKDDSQKLRLETPGGQNGHEMAQAENISDAAKSAKYDYILVLVGNIHAQTAEIVRPNFSLQPMVMHLQKSGKVVSLNMAYSGGSAWNCLLKEGLERQPGKPITKDMIDCSTKPVRGLSISMGAPYLGLGQFGETTAAENYDGYYWLGTVTGSPPAVP